MTRPRQLRCQYLGSQWQREGRVLIKVKMQCGLEISRGRLAWHSAFAVKECQTASLWVFLRDIQTNSLICYSPTFTSTMLGVS
jgi:hypothetical protein